MVFHREDPAIKFFLSPKVSVLLREESRRGSQTLILVHALVCTGSLGLRDMPVPFDGYIDQGKRLSSILWKPMISHLVKLKACSR